MPPDPATVNAELALQHAEDRLAGAYAVARAEGYRLGSDALQALEEAEQQYWPARQRRDSAVHRPLAATRVVQLPAAPP